MEQLAVVVYRPKSGGKWKQQSDGVFSGEEAVRLASNYVECLNAQSEAYVHAYVVGPITNPLEMAEASASLGEF